MIFRTLTRSVLAGFIALRAGGHVWRYQALSRLGVMSFQQASEGISRIPFFLGYRIRERFYKRLLARCGDRLEVNYGSTIAERETEIGDDVWVGPFCFIDLAVIGNQVLIGPHVCILAG